MVDYDVILKAPYTEGYENVVEDIRNNVKEKIQNATAQQVLVDNNCSKGKVLLEGSALRG